MQRCESLVFDGPLHGQFSAIGGDADE
ncbi:MAG: hypothetical protein RI897_4225, partial [Verrucomicrobiota bacterium]